MSDRYARLNHGYGGAMACAEMPVEARPEACSLGSADAQNAAAEASLAMNGLTFLTSSLIGSLSDEHGRKRKGHLAVTIVLLLLVLRFREKAKPCCRFVPIVLPFCSFTPLLFPFFFFFSFHFSPLCSSRAAILMIGLFISMLSPLALYVTQLAPSVSPWWYYGANVANGFVNWVAIGLSSLNDVLPQELRAPGLGLFLAGSMLGRAHFPPESLAVSTQDPGL